MGTSNQQGLTGSGAFALDPTSPVEAAIIEIVKMQRAKTRDYAEDGSIFSNFEMTADLTNQAPEESALFNVAQKLVRLRSLKANGRTNDPTNESVQDTYLDLAVYAVIAYAIVQQSARSYVSEARVDMLTEMTDEINRTVKTQQQPATEVVESKQGVDYRYTINTSDMSAEQVAAQVRNGLNWHGA